MNGTQTKKLFLWSALVLISVTSSDPLVVAQDSGTGHEATVSLVTAEDRKPTEIPLSRVWAYQMPGTRDARRIDFERPQDSLIEPIRESLTMLQDAEKEAGVGFAVQGVGHEALRKTYDIVVAGEDVPRELPADSELSVVFLSRQYPFYVHVHKVEREGNEITVYYHFSPHMEFEETQHFALIPVSKLLPGTYHVRVLRSPRKIDYRRLMLSPAPKDAEHRVVFQSFTFVVTKNPFNP